MQKVTTNHMKGEHMNDIATIVIEHRNSADELVDQSDPFDADRNKPWEITARINEFIQTKSIFPTDSIVVAEIEFKEEN